MMDGVEGPDLSRHDRLRMKFGESFPDLDEVDRLMGEGKAAEAGRLWRDWLDEQVEAQKAVMEVKRLHWIRHRLFRSGIQWISSRDNRSWREMEARNNRIRRSFNVIGPGLDFRLSLLEEQRPGWRHEPIPGMGVDGRETAEAQQSLVEHLFKTQKIWRLMRLAHAQAQTDGVAFLQGYVNKSKGPTVDRVKTVADDDERFQALKAAGYQEEEGVISIPLGPTSEELSPDDKPSSFNAGELATRLVLAGETVCDPEAETINGPNNPARWFVVRRPRDILGARRETNRPKLQADPDATYSHLYGDGLDQRYTFSMGLPPFPKKRMVDGDANVWDITMYFAPDDDISPDGLIIHLVGDHLMSEKKLPKRIIPIVRITDGSSDPEMYPRPVMSDWINDQVTVNATGSKILEYVRMHSGSRILALKDTIIEETWNNISGSIVNYQGAKPDMLPPPRVSPDMWSMFTHMVQTLKDQMGYNDLNMGKVSNVDSGFQDVSGRAVLGAREMSERQFGPMIRAAADGATDWAEVMVLMAQELYQVPRLIPMTGRPDLAKRIDGDTLQGIPTVYIDPETLMPMPRALRNQMLIDHLDRGLITQAEYSKRAPYAEVRDLTLGDTDQWNRAQWINTVMEERHEELYDEDPILIYSPSGLPVFWQDTPEVHMRALEEIILDERKPWTLRKIAADRWGIYAELARSKNFPMELEIQGMPRPPAPLEVLGVPNMVPQTPEVSQQARPQGGGGVPGARGQGNVMAGDTAPVARQGLDRALEA